MNPASIPSSRIEARSRGGPADDLETRILDAERAVIERDERVQREAQHLVRRAERFVERAREHAGRLAAAGAALAVAGVVAARWLPHLASARAGVAGHPGGRLPAPSHGRRHRPFPWGRALALAWPLMPLGLRSRVSPKTATLLMSLGLPLVARGAQGRAEPPVQAASSVDLRRFAGRWHEIARLPMRQEKLCAGRVIADYTLLADGPGDADVVLGITNRCRTRDGRLAIAVGDARVVRGSRGARLQVCYAPQWLRWLPMVWDDLWILHVDDAYASALVGTPDRRHLWLLGRAPQLPGAELRVLVEQARAQGYDTGRLRLTPQ